jgi:hypothetical protein
MCCSPERSVARVRWAYFLIPVDALGGVDAALPDVVHKRSTMMMSYSNVSPMIRRQAILGVKMSSSCPVYRWSQVRIAKASAVGVPNGAEVLVMSRTQYLHVCQ